MTSPGSGTGVREMKDLSSFAAILTSVDKMGNAKKNKSSPGKELIKQDRTSTLKSPVHIIPALTSSRKKLPLERKLNIFNSIQSANSNST